MDNNKNLMKTREKSNAEIRKMFPKDGANVGMENGKKVGSTVKRVSKRSKPSK